MRTESNIRPEKFEINELPDNTTEIIFSENIEQTEEDRYTFDLYTVVVPTRPMIATNIDDNYQQWLDFAKTK